METYNRIYQKIYDFNNLVLAYTNARKNKTKRDYVINFEKNLNENLLKLQEELKNQTYKPKPLVTFILRDPKTRKINKSDFRDRIVHHALVRIIEPVFDKTFIYDSCANRIGKGNLFALKRLAKFFKKVSKNGKNNGWFEGSVKGFCLKADIKHYFQEVNHDVLIEIIKRKITDERTIWLVKQILNNTPNEFGEGGRR